MFRHLVSGLAVAALSTLPASGQLTTDAAASAALAFHRPVSSDGTVAPRAESTGRVSPGFEGYAPGFMADDSHATFASGEESVEAVWSLLELPPAVAPIGRESILGADNRTRVTQTTQYPARAVVLVTFDGGRCSGSLISRNTVLTAGHCVNTGGPFGAWRTNVRVYPGRNGALSPYGSCAATRLYSVSGWTQQGLEAYDYGVIKLGCNIGNTTGWFGFFWKSGTLNGLGAQVAGYPGDKPLQQWRAAGTVTATQTLQTFYQTDTLGGQSGSGVYTTNGSGCSGACIHSVHAYGVHGGAPHANNNHGTRITQAVFANLQTWVAAAP